MSKTIRDALAARGGLNQTTLVGVLGRAAGKVALLGQQRTRARLSGRVLNRRTGNLLATAHGSVEQEPDGLRIVFQAGGGPRNVKYARIHELGGTITPKNGQALRFKGRNGWATVKSVTMPRRPYLEPSRDEAAKALEPTLTRELKIALGSA